MGRLGLSCSGGEDREHVWRVLKLELQGAGGVQEWKPHGQEAPGLGRAELGTHVGDLFRILLVTMKMMVCVARDGPEPRTWCR